MFLGVISNNYRLSIHWKTNNLKFYRNSCKILRAEIGFFPTGYLQLDNKIVMAMFILTRIKIW